MFQQNVSNRGVGEGSGYDGWGGDAGSGDDGCDFTTPIYNTTKYITTLLYHYYTSFDHHHHRQQTRLCTTCGMRLRHGHVLIY